jgi:3-hydroxybutyryl-CoA dehydratase
VIPDRTFEDIQIGEEHAFEVDVTEERMKMFRDLTGDENPLHTDEAYAKSTQFGRRVVYGKLLDAFFSRLIGHHVPGRRALYLSQNTRFDAPCFVGDRIRVSGRVTEKHERSRLIVIETLIHRLPGMDMLASGSATAMVM